MRYLFIIALLFSVGAVFADSDGVWHEAEDIRGGIVGSDELVGGLFPQFIFNGLIEFNNFVNFTSVTNFNNKIMGYFGLEIVSGDVSLPNGTIDLNELSSNSVDSSKVVDGSLTLGDLGSNSVDSSKVVDNSLTADDIGENSIGASEFNEFESYELNSLKVDGIIESNGNLVIRLN